MQYYFHKEEHNFKPDVPHGDSKTNSRHHKCAKESVKTAIKKSILRPTGVVNDLFQHAGWTLEVKSRLDFPKCLQEVNVQRMAK